MVSDNAVTYVTHTLVVTIVKSTVPKIVPYQSSLVGQGTLVYGWVRNSYFSFTRNEVMKISPKNHTINGVEIEILIEIDLKIQNVGNFAMIGSKVILDYVTKLSRFLVFTFSDENESV